MNPRPMHVTYVSPYKLIITFTDKKVKMFDLQPYLNFPIYQILQDESFCSKATVQHGTVVWNDEVDMDPDRLYLDSREVTKERV
jgi:hypothetical protein